MAVQATPSTSLVIVPGTRKVHEGRTGSLMLECSRTATGEHLASLPDDTHSTLMRALLEQRVAPSRLCATCFSTVARASYRQFWRDGG